MALVLVAVSVLVGLPVVTSHAGGTGSSSVPTPVALPHYPATPAKPLVTPKPATSGFPRTVLIQTFTGQWCPHCPKESQALYDIQHKMNTSVVVVPELHVCYSPTYCGDSYTPIDGTTDNTITYYGVQGFPTVFFDGKYGVVGDRATTAEVETLYTTAIANATQYPGNVSISQSAWLSDPGNVTVQASVTSLVTGTYTAISYLTEFIGKNDSTGHDLGFVTHESVIDQNVALTAGQTTQIEGKKAILPMWNPLKLDVVTFIQQNSTKYVQNANFAPVSTVKTALVSNVSSVLSNATASITVTVTNSSTGALVPGANVSLSANGGGVFSPSSGVTSAMGTFTTTFTAPSVSATLSDVLSAQSSGTGIVGGSGNTELFVNPIVLPSAPTAVTLAPQDSAVLVGWTAPGGGALTYHVWRSTSQTSGFSDIGVSTMTSFVDNGLATSSAYWYKVDAENSYGFSPNTTAVLAVPVVASTQGLGTIGGWWLSVDSTLLTATDNGSLSLHLPLGSYSYTFGPTSYAYTTPTGTGTVSVTGSALVTFTTTFVPRYALLQGTVTPTTATVTLNGAAVSVSGGAFSEELIAGSYTLVVSEDSYITNSQTVVMTPGNTTPINVELQPVSGTGPTTVTPSSNSGGLPITEVVAILAVVGVLGAVGVAVVMMRSRRQP